MIKPATPALEISGLMTNQGANESRATSDRGVQGHQSTGRSMRTDYMGSKDRPVQTLAWNSWQNYRDSERDLWPRSNHMWMYKRAPS